MSSFRGKESYKAICDDTEGVGLEKILEPRVGGSRAALFGARPRIGGSGSSFEGGVDVMLEIRLSTVTEHT